MTNDEGEAPDAAGRDVVLPFRHSSFGFRPSRSPPVRPGPTYLAWRISGNPARVILWPADTPADELPADVQRDSRSGLWLALRMD